MDSESSDNLLSSSVIVIGAGISGISAARVLAENGVNDFVILEASNRIGGRIRKENFGGFTVETGAGWIQGVGGREKNPVWELAGKFQLRMCFSDYTNAKFNIYDQNGNVFPSGFATESYNKAVESAVCELRNQETGTIAAPSFVPSTPIELAIDYILHDFEMAEVEPIATYTDLGEREFLVADERGYDYLLYKLAENFLSTTSDGEIIDNRLKLNKVVRKIRYAGNNVSVETEDGCIYKAQNVIVSVSIGVLQSGLINFTPSLPKRKLEAILKCEVIVYTKIFLKFPYKFWPCGPGTEFFLYAHEKRGYYTFWQRMDNAYPGCNILVVTLTNEESKRVESQSEEVTLKEAMGVLRDMFGKGIPDAQQILVPKWWNNRFQRGSYSNYPIFATRQDFRDIKAPVGPIFFTGEHTSERFNGYVHGGYLSGIDTANCLLEAINERERGREREREREREMRTTDSNDTLNLKSPLMLQPFLALTESLGVTHLQKWDYARHLFLSRKLAVQEAIK